MNPGIILQIRSHNFSNSKRN